MRKEKSEKEVKSKETGRSPVPILDLERQQTPRTWALTLFSIFSVFNMSLSPCPKVCRRPFTRDLAMIPMQHCNAVMLADATAKTRASLHNGLVCFLWLIETHTLKRPSRTGTRAPGTLKNKLIPLASASTCRLQRPRTPKDSKGSKGPRTPPHHSTSHRVPGSEHQVPSKTSSYHLQVLPRVPTAEAKDSKDSKSSKGPRTPPHHSTSHRAPGSPG